MLAFGDAVRAVDIVARAADAERVGTIAIVARYPHVERQRARKIVALGGNRGADSDRGAVEVFGELDVARRAVVGHPALARRAGQRVVIQRRRARDAVVDQRAFGGERVGKRLEQIQRGTVHVNPVRTGLPVAIVDVLERDQALVRRGLRERRSGHDARKRERGREQSAGGTRRSGLTREAVSSSSVAATATAADAVASATGLLAGVDVIGEPGIDRIGVELHLAASRAVPFPRVSAAACSRSRRAAATIGDGGPTPRRRDPMRPEL